MATVNWYTPVSGAVIANTTNGTGWYINGGSYMTGATWTIGPTDTVKVEEPDTFADWVTEVRRIAALEESIQGS